jgi:hypothetical protein
MAPQPGSGLEARITHSTVRGGASLRQGLRPTARYSATWHRVPGLGGARWRTGAEADQDLSSWPCHRHRRAGPRGAGNPPRSCRPPFQRRPSWSRVSEPVGVVHRGPLLALPCPGEPSGRSAAGIVHMGYKPADAVGWASTATPASTPSPTTASIAGNGGLDRDADRERPQSRHRAASFLVDREMLSSSSGRRRAGCSKGARRRPTFLRLRWQLP